jgi:hypothetical protein
MRTTAAAPSEYGLALPAVTVPPALKAGGSLARRSALVSLRTSSSTANSPSSTCFFVPCQVTRWTGTGTIWSANALRDWASAALRWLPNA